MNTAELRQIIKEAYNDVVFVYNEKQSGVTSEVCNSIPTFQVWYGEYIKEYSNIDDLMTDKFYDGKSLDELIDETQFTVL